MQKHILKELDPLILTKIWLECNGRLREEIEDEFVSAKLSKSITTDPATAGTSNTAGSSAKC
jgi:hypothetical protein